MTNREWLTIKVWGEWACFTRPELKVERVSYPVMTPSAARGVLEAVFWKPEMHWEVSEIRVLQPIRYFSILRNEILQRQTLGVARNWQRTGGGLDASNKNVRVQRHTVGLRDVAYIIVARPRLNPGSTADVAKYRDQFRRRVQQGRCFATPFLGCREFSASFGPPSSVDRPTNISMYVGPMLHQIDYRTDGSGTGIPRFFDATVTEGVLRVPAQERGG